MTPEEMAALHRAAFVIDAPWSEASFAELCDSKWTHVIAHPDGFAIIRTLAGETELLTLAVQPNAQRRGTGRQLVLDWIEQAKADAQTAFLEVAADNLAAMTLYATLGFQETGRRPAYYVRKSGQNVDAIVMSRPLTHG